MKTLVLLAAGIGLIGGSDVSRRPAASSAPSARLDRSGKVPFHVGEQLTYQAKVNFLNAGTATMSVEDVEPYRGHTTYHTIFDVKGRVLLFHVNDHYESWFLSR